MLFLIQLLEQLVDKLSERVPDRRGPTHVFDQQLETPTDPKTVLTDALAQLMAVLADVGSSALCRLNWVGDNEHRLPGVPVRSIREITGVDEQYMQLMVMMRSERHFTGYFDVANAGSRWGMEEWVTWAELPWLLLQISPSRSSTLDRYEALTALQISAKRFTKIAAHLGMSQQVIAEVIRGSADVTTGHGPQH